jgi:hypothetical protein
MYTEIPEKKLQHQIKGLLGFFIFALFISGFTAIPVQEQLEWLIPCTDDISGLRVWFKNLYEGVKTTKQNFPMLFYGFDWLAFAHFMIAILFVGPYKNPVKNKWVIEFGMIACVLLIPYALVFGSFRQIPFWWRLIDCSFGILGFAVLWTVYEKLRLLENQLKKA